jgi:hypothetical protein
MTDTTLAQDLQRLRRALAEARLNLRATTERHKRIQAEREVAIIAGLYGGDPKNMGANQADRDRQMTIELTHDNEYQDVSEELFRTTAAVTRLEAETEGLRDLRREREWLSRDKLADALLALPNSDVLAEVLR